VRLEHSAQKQAPQVKLEHSERLHSLLEQAKQLRLLQLKSKQLMSLHSPLLLSSALPSPGTLHSQQEPGIQVKLD
jgi:hypothetical protein